jgi:hypothetical protein
MPHFCKKDHDVGLILVSAAAFFAKKTLEFVQFSFQITAKL